MIENVLDFARIEQGRKQYEFEPADVMALVEQTVMLMQPYAAERGVGIDLRKGSPEPERGSNQILGSSDHANLNGFGGFIADIDGQAIQQALVNLVDNAIKHSPDGERVVVTLRSRADDVTSEIAPPGPRLHLSVEDHGPGIPAGEHARIFERFYRLGSELRRETQGVGIGLSIVKHIVEAHHGSVSVESQPGKGSRFTIELPLHHEELAE
jgi:signal transduction histidine kinase